jgi:multimeric flavodoxin WrbA
MSPHFRVKMKKVGCAMRKIVVFMGSPRKKGNTDLLVDAFVSGAERVGADVKKILLYEQKITPCIECGGCDKSGKCVLEDDMQGIYDLIKEADVVVVASPIFFYNITAVTQALVERAQAFWIGKYVLKQVPVGGRKREGLFVSVGATKGKMLFDGACRVMKYFFDAIDAEYRGELLYRGLDAKGAVAEHEHALKDARELGRRIASGDSLDDCPLVM